MAARFYQVVVDSFNPTNLAQFWAEALYLQVLSYEGDEVTIGSGANTYPGICFVPVPDSKITKNRLHIDIEPDDQDLEVERLLELGAERVDIGQEDVSWVVLADPEGNEFCVLTPRNSLVD